MSIADLSSFWKRTIKEMAGELAEFKPNPTMEEAPEQSARDYRTRRVVLDSFQGRRLRGWYTTPTDPAPGGKFPGVLAVPGYGGAKVIPTTARNPAMTGSARSNTETYKLKINNTSNRIGPTINI